MKNKKGFTLIELLAVVVILAIVTALVSSTLIKTKKRSNIENVKTYENTLKNLGMQIYMYEDLNDLAIGAQKKYLVQELKDMQYLDSYLSNPEGGYCDGYLLISKTSDGPVFKGYINCPDLYTTQGY